MNTSNCPRCHEKVTLPFGGRPESRVRCPMCQEEYLLGEAMETLPPTLELLDGPVAAAPMPAYAGHGAASLAGTSSDEAFGTDAFGAPYAAPTYSAPAPGIADDDAGSFGAPMEEDANAAFETPEETATPASRTAPSRARPKKKKKQANPVMEIAKVVIGGMVGLVLAQLILFWLPGKWPDRNRDPAKIAKYVYEYVPWVVPEQLRPKETPDISINQDGKQVAQTNGNSASTKQNSNANENGNKKSNNPAKKPAPPKAKKTETPEVSNDDPFGSPPPTNPSIPAPSLDLLATPKTTDPLDLATPDLPKTPSIDTPSLDIPKTEPAKTENPKPASATTERPGLKKIEKLEENVLVNALAGVTTAQEEFGKASAAGEPPAKRLALFGELYVAMTKIGEHSAHLKAAENLPNAQVDSVITTGLELLKTKVIAAGVDRYAAKAFTDTGREQPGVVLVGQVAEFQQRGKLYAMLVKQSQLENPVTVLFNETPEGSFQPGQKVVVFGLLMDNPTETLTGFDGADKTVVVEGISFLAPSE